MSDRVSTSSRLIDACSGLMYAGVPIIWPYEVNRVFSVSLCSVALATPKSMILTTGVPSLSVTITFDGLMSRWMTPLWCACWMAWHTETKSLSRSSVVE